jgi:hypothetical protein
MKTTAKALYPFVPSGPDFATSLTFFAEIGFAAAWRREGLAGLRFGDAYFLLQDIALPAWQENQMLVYEVDDLDLYWSELAALDLPSRYPGVRLRPPVDFPWGRELHIVDPAGVCWHVKQAPGRDATAFA